MREALAGRSIIATARERRGAAHPEAGAPVEFHGVRWALVAAQSIDEALGSPVASCLGLLSCIAAMAGSLLQLVTSRRHDSSSGSGMAIRTHES